MKMVVMGGGKTGQSLTRALLDRKYEVSLIEKSGEWCQHLADALDAAVYKGDGTNVDLLEAAGTRDCDCFMAVTGTDQDNLTAAQLAKKYFGAKKVIARVNDPLNVETFRLLGIDNIVCSAEILTRMIEKEADAENMHLVATLNEGRAGVCSMTLPEGSALDGLSLSEIELPRDTLLIAVIRNGELTIPNGSTVLKRGDEVVAIANERVQKQLVKTLSETV